jgi:hypothetical protein
MLTAVVYGLVGRSGAYQALAWKAVHRRAAVRS